MEVPLRSVSLTKILVAKLKVALLSLTSPEAGGAVVVASYVNFAFNPPLNNRVLFEISLMVIWVEIATKKPLKVILRGI